LSVSADHRQVRAEEVSRYDAMLFGACGEAYLRDLQTLARIFDVEPGALSPHALWSQLRPLATKGWSTSGTSG